MENFKEGNLEIKLEAGDKNVMTWSGRSEDRDPGSLLNPYINKIIESLKGKDLEVVFTKLDYMNSSTVPPIVQLVKMLNQNKIKSVIYYDMNSKWQTASFKALETIAKTMDCVSVVGK